MAQHKTTMPKPKFDELLKEANKEAKRLKRLAQWNRLKRRLKAAREALQPDFRATKLTDPD